MDEERYKKVTLKQYRGRFVVDWSFQVLYQCCLERDLELFDASDETEVGEKVSLSIPRVI